MNEKATIIRDGDLRAAVREFLRIYRTPKTELAGMFCVSYKTLNEWLNDNLRISDRSRERIYNVLREIFPKINDYVKF